MATWLNSADGSTVTLRPSRVLFIDGEAHAFGRLDRPGREEFRLSSPALEVAEKDGAIHIRTRSRTYVCAGQDAVLPVGASAQLREFLTAWAIPTEQWPEILAQLGSQSNC